MKFAHLADSHIGAYRDPKLRALNIKSFDKSIEMILEENVDFVLIAGDLFNTSFPSADALISVIKKLKILKEIDIPVYVVSGSHDFSPSGKTMISVLEETGLVINVVKGEIKDKKLQLHFTTDKKTGAKITGMIGKKGLLDKKYYEELDLAHLEREDGFKIFMFHTTLTEFKTIDLQKIDSIPLSAMPKDFNYYAGGHLHFFAEKKYGAAPVVYPGPVFPNNFREIEDLKQGSFVIYDDQKPDEKKVELKKIQIINTFSLKIDCNEKNPSQIEENILTEIKNREFLNTVVTLRLFGTISAGKPTDITWREIYAAFEKKQAYFVLKNTDKLVSKEFSEIKIESSNVEQIEESLISEHAGKISSKELNDLNESELIKKLMSVLSREKNEGETKVDFEKRIINDLGEIFN